MFDQDTVAVVVSEGVEAGLAGVVALAADSGQPGLCPLEIESLVGP
jgi:hypothetical protein